MTPVEVARSNGDLTAIASGLNGGEHIIVEGQSELADGQTVVEQFSDKGGAAANLAANIPQVQVGGQ